VHVGDFDAFLIAFNEFNNEYLCQTRLDEFF
jgi:hypothetical protein